MFPFYRLSNPYDDRFARSTRLGTWEPCPSPAPCVICGVPFEKRVSPLVISWELTSKKDTVMIGDFTWPGFLDDIIVTERVMNNCNERYQGLKFGPILMNNSPPKPLDSSLLDLQITRVTCLDIPKSKVDVEINCKKCGRVFYKPPSHRNLIVNNQSGLELDFFVLKEFPSWRFVTERVKTDMNSRKYTNVDFVEYGVVT